MDEELREWLKKQGKKVLIGFMIFVLIFVGLPGFYVYFSGRLEVPPQTVKVVKEFSFKNGSFSIVSKVYENKETKRSEVFRKWPVIPGTKIGYVEKEYSLKDPFKFERKGFYSWSKYDRTGNKDDLKTVEGYVLYGEFTVQDWQSYVNMIDPSLYTTGEKEIIEREDIVGWIIEQALIYAGQNYYPQVESEFFARIDFIKALKDKAGLKDPEEIKSFIIENVPWYWALGVNQFEGLAWMGRIYGEQPISPWFGEAGTDWQNKFATGQITEQDIAFCCFKAYEFEKKMLSDPKTITEEEKAFYKDVLLPLFQALCQMDTTNGLYDNELLWSMAVEGAFKPVDEAALKFMKEMVPSVLENGTKIVLTQDQNFAEFLKLINLKIAVKFEERPLFTEDGTVDPDFQQIYSDHWAEISAAE